MMTEEMPKGSFLTALLCSSNLMGERNIVRRSVHDQINKFNNTGNETIGLDALLYYA
jgi:hypothetical protein